MAQAEAPPAEHRPVKVLYCRQGLCRLPHGTLHRHGALLEIRSRHGGEIHIYTATLAELAAELGYRLVPLEPPGEC